MPRALAGAVGTMLAIAVVVSPSKAQVSAPQLQGQQTPAQMDPFHRLDVMKIELALLNDVVTFPYSVAAASRGESLELYGFVPNDRINRHALDVARRTTPLIVNDAMGFQANQALPLSPRPAAVMQKEGTALLQSELDEAAKQVTLQAQTDGTIVLIGRVDSVENKLRISRLFRQLSGCCRVDNKLIVEPIVRDGRRFVRVTRDGSLLASPSALGQMGSFASSSSPVLLSSNNQSTQKGRLNLSAAVPPRPPSTPLKPTPEKIANVADPFAPSKLPVKWGRPANGWETQAKELEKLQAARKQALMPTAVETPKRSPEPKIAQALPRAIKPAESIVTPRLNFAEARPGGSEESEPRIQPPTREADVSAKSRPALRSSRRWPPAYVTGSPPSQGRPGVIVFEDDPPPTKSAFAAMARSRPIVPADLQHEVQRLCGREAREVTVATQRDGSVLVRVTVANRSIEDQLSRRILSLPEMTSPQVRLLMEVEP